MQLDNCIQMFIEKYDEDAIQSIDEISNNRSLVKTNATINAFNMDESFDDFIRFLNEYTKYHIEHSDEPSNADKMKCIVGSYVDKELFQEASVLYHQLPDFISHYITRTSDLIHKIEESKSSLIQHNIDEETIGVINEFADIFANKLNNLFYPMMENVLKASGYYTKKFFKEKLYRNKEPKPVFL